MNYTSQWQGRNLKVYLGDVKRGKNKVSLSLGTLGPDPYPTFLKAEYAALYLFYTVYWGSTLGSVWGKRKKM